jgi:DNA-binding phage protein
MTLKELVKEEMDKQNLNMHKLGILANIDPAGMTRFFTRKGSNPSFRTVIKLIKALKIEPTKLLEVSENGEQ